MLKLAPVAALAVLALAPVAQAHHGDPVKPDRTYLHKSEARAFTEKVARKVSEQQHAPARVGRCDRINRTHVDCQIVWRKCSVLVHVRRYDHRPTMVARTEGYRNAVKRCAS